MPWDSKDFQEYGETQQYGEAPKKIDYADPDYYRQDGQPTHYSKQSLMPPMESYADYANGPTLVNDQGPGMMGEYRGPASMEGYTIDVGAEQREAAERGKAEAGKKRKGLAGLGGVGASIGALLLKLKGLAFLLKFGWAGFSALFSIAIYSLIFGWPFAVGLVALLFIHEMGHALVMKLKGIPVGGMIFVPMLGAAVFMRQMPKNARDEAEVGIAGPVAGALAAGACLFMAELTPYAPTIWAALAYFGFFMNLINLVPVLPFDGGRVLGAIDRRVWIIGFLGLLAFQIWQWLSGYFSIWLLLFVVIAATQFWARRGTANTPAMKEYYNVPVSSRIALSIAYFGLAAALVFGMTIAHTLLLGAG